MRKLWFKAKTYGWGWVPCSWEGWLVIASYVVCIVVYVRVTVDKALDGGGSGVPLYYHLLPIVATVALIGISYTNGEKPGWRWGRGTKGDEDVN